MSNLKEVNSTNPMSNILYLNIENGELNPSKNLITSSYFPDFRYSRGVQDLCERLHTTFLLDISLVYSKRNNINFQIFTFKFDNINEIATLRIVGNKGQEIMAEIEIDFFKTWREEVVLWSVGNTIFLPTEY